MKKVLIFALAIVICNLCAKGQNYAEVRLKSSEAHQTISVIAASGSQFYTDDESVDFDAIDSIVFFYQPSASVLNNLIRNGVSHSIKIVDLESIEKPPLSDAKYGLDWVVLTNRDSLFGYIEERQNKIVFNDPLKFEDQKIPHYEIRSYKKGEVIYEYHDGMKALEVMGDLNLYSFAQTYTNSSGLPGTATMTISTSTKISYFVKRKNENRVTFLARNGGLNTSFKATALEYFADCPDLVDKIETGFFTKRDVFEIVNFYNARCSGE